MEYDEEITPDNPIIATLRALQHDMQEMKEAAKNQFHQIQNNQAQSNTRQNEMQAALTQLALAQAAASSNTPTTTTGSNTPRPTSDTGTTDHQPAPEPNTTGHLPVPGLDSPHPGVTSQTQGPPNATTLYTKRKPLPEGPKFDGSKKMFASWLATTRYKLAEDECFIGGDRNKWHYIWGNLTEKAQQRVTAFYEIGGTSGDHNPEEFLNYMQSVFQDNHRMEMAQTELEMMEQGKDELFSTYIVRFEQTLALAGGLQWDDGVKLTRLRRGLNKRMKECCLGRGIARNNYANAITSYRSVAVDIETLLLEDRYRARHQARHPTPAPARRDAEGDTPMTGINSARSTRGANRGRSGRGGQRRQAEWVTQDVMRQRREDGSCLRCGKTTHRIAACDLAPARRPVQVNTLDAEEEEDSADEDSQSENTPPPN